MFPVIGTNGGRLDQQYSKDDSEFPPMSNLKSLRLSAIQTDRSLRNEKRSSLSLDSWAVVDAWNEYASSRTPQIALGCDCLLNAFSLFCGLHSDLLAFLGELHDRLPLEGIEARGSIMYFIRNLQFADDPMFQLRITNFAADISEDVNRNVSGYVPVRASIFELLDFISRQLPPYTDDRRVLRRTVKEITSADYDELCGSLCAQTERILGMLRRILLLEDKLEEALVLEV